MGKYDDIIHFSRPLSKYPRMSLKQRAAQFAPYAALTGYGDQIAEEARLVESRIELDEEKKKLFRFKNPNIKRVCF